MLGYKIIVLGCVRVILRDVLFDLVFLMNLDNDIINISYWLIYDI